MLKKKLIESLSSNDLAVVAALAQKDRKVLSALVRISYAKDTLVGWRAIITIGMAARELVRTAPVFLRETCRKLLWSLSDESGGIGWSAPELLGEIVSADPKRFHDLIPLIARVFDMEEKVFRPGVVYALSRIAESDPAAVYEHQNVVIASLHDSDPLVRVFGLQLAGKLWSGAARSGAWTEELLHQARKEVERLSEDNGEAWVYEGKGFVSVLVAEVAKKTLENIIN